MKEPGRALTQGEIARAAGVIMAAYVLSGILGLIRQVILSSTFGADQDLDAFYAALRLPETLFTLIAGGALGSTFIPVFSGFLNREDFQGAWRLASILLTMVTLIAILAAVTGFLLARPLVESLLLPGADGDTQTLAIELMRIMLVTVVLFGISGLVMGILNAHQHFLAPALTPSMYNVGIIVGTLLFVPSLGVHGLAWGAVLGAGLHLSVQLPSVLRLPQIKLTPVVNLDTEGVSEVLMLMGPRLLGLGVVQINFWVNIALASAMVTGSITALQTAYTLMFTILGILGQSLGTAVFPTLAAQQARGDQESFQRTFSAALRNVLFLSIPAGIGLAILAQPIVGVLFERREWSTADTQATAWALIFYSVGLTGHAALEILARTFYALHDTWTPVIVGGLAMGLNIALSVIFVLLFKALGADSFTRGPFAGLALANSLATALESATLWLILRRRIPAIKPQPVLKTLGRTLAAAGGMMVVVGLWLTAVGAWAQFIQLAGGVLVGAVSFWGLAILLKINEAQTIARQFLARFGSR